jgi:hypothetical protein
MKYRFVKWDSGLVSYGNDTQQPMAHCHFERSEAKSRNLHACRVPDAERYYGFMTKSFLWKWYTVLPCRAGNYLRKVSYGDDTQWFHAGQETIREKFPMEVIRNGSMPDRKLFTKGFLWKWYTVCP